MTEPRPADAPAPGLHPIGSDPVDPAAAERAAVDAARAIPYAVWAPHAESVDLVLVDTEPGALHDAEDRWPVAAVVAMAPAAGGWWTPTEDPLAALGLDAAQPPADPGYGYRVDGADPVPDPRSRRQPDTVHGPSRRDVAGRVFAWPDEGWAGPPGVESDPAAPQGGGLRGAVLYELHVGTFTAEGTLDAAIAALPT